MKVSEILKKKGGDVMTVKPAETLATLSHRLRMARVGALVVSETGSRVDGIVSERDVVHALAERGLACLETPVSAVMSRRVVTCGPEDHISAIARTMTDRRIRHLPVLEAGRLVGIISLGDVVKHRLDEMELEAGVLRDIAAAH